MMPVPILRTVALAVEAGDKRLLSCLDWQVNRGEFWCVLGKNGIGKSSLLHVLAGLLVPADGEVWVGERKMDDMAPRDLALWRGLLMQQQFDAFASSVLETVMTGRYPYQTGVGWGSDDDKAIAVQALAHVRMEAFIQDDVMRLSGGQRQRVALATLLAQMPQLYLLDEPTSHQDMAAQLFVMRLLRQLATHDNKAAVATCHDINLASQFATHILLLGDGQYWHGRVRDVLQVDSLQQAFGCAFQVSKVDRHQLFFPSEL